MIGYGCIFGVGIISIFICFRIAQPTIFNRIFGCYPALVKKINKLTILSLSNYFYRVSILREVYAVIICFVITMDKDDGLFRST
jgi:hypothetical protein